MSSNLCRLCSILFVEQRRLFPDAQKHTVPQFQELRRVVFIPDMVFIGNRTGEGGGAVVLMHGFGINQFFFCQAHFLVNFSSSPN